MQMELPVDQTALVLVYLWDNHFIESWLERADRITRDAVVPVLCDQLVHSQSSRTGHGAARLRYDSAARCDDGRRVSRYAGSGDGPKETNEVGSTRDKGERG